MSLGRGVLNTMSAKQKLNTKSSTEAEFVGESDAMSQIIWTRYLMEAQGYEIDENVIGQDNMSTMLLENNGRASRSIVLMLSWPIMFSSISYPCVSCSVKRHQNNNAALNVS